MTPLELLQKVRERHEAAFADLKAFRGAQYVPGEGSHRARVMLIGEAPGAHEAVQRRPFVGPSGAVLRQFMAEAGLHTRDRAPQFFDDGTGHTGTYEEKANCWLTNVVKFRPPKNRTPFPTEVKRVRHLLRAEWRAVGRPAVVIAVGAIAWHAIRGKQLSIITYAGMPWSRETRDGKVVTVWPMLHPAYGLHEPKVRPLMEKHWDDFIEWWEERDSN